MSVQEVSRPQPSPTPTTPKQIERTDTSFSGSLVPVAFYEVPAVWGKVGPVLRRAVDAGAGEMNLRDVFDALVKQRMQLWVSIEGDEVKAAATTEIQFHPRMKTCLIRLGAGKLDNIVKNVEPIARWAKSQGCDALEVYGRKGWERILSDWNMTHIVMRKDLT